jgi:hypothetical protein
VDITVRCGELSQNRTVRGSIPRRGIILEEFQLLQFIEVAHGLLVCDTS